MTTQNRVKVGLGVQIMLLTQFPILIDSGSTHNFIKPTLAEQLGLPVTPCDRFRVVTGCGTFLVCQLCRTTTPLLIQGITFPVVLFVVTIEGPDVVLGFPWLQSLGNILMIILHLLWNLFGRVPMLHWWGILTLLKAGCRGAANAASITPQIVQLLRCVMSK